MNEVRLKPDTTDDHRILVQEATELVKIVSHGIRKFRAPVSSPFGIWDLTERSM